MTDIALPDHPIADDETLIERRYRFLTQRNAGATISAIAERHNKLVIEAAVSAGRDVSEARTVSTSTVRKDIDWALRDIIAGSTRENLIARCASVILDVRRANYGAMASGDIDAAKIVLATVAQEREMFGLDAPKRAQIGVGSDVEFARDLASLITSVGLEPPSDLVFAAQGENPLRRELEPLKAKHEVIEAEIMPEAGLLDVTSPDPAPRRAVDDRWSNL